VGNVEGDRIGRYGDRTTLWAGGERQRRHRMVFRNPHGVPDRTTLDPVVLPFLARVFSRSQSEEMAWEKLETIGLANVAKSAFRTLSGGDAQRLMLARGIAATPQLFAIIAG
jgi:ABC-type proline/glycine betaine transport system ATPase subunit